VKRAFLRRYGETRFGVVEVRGQFGNEEEGKLPTLEAVNRRLVKTVTEDTTVCICMCVTVIYKM
jgi:hypothetical protein